jgi:TrkA family protein
MVAIITLLIVLLISLIAMRIATVALTLTGLSQELARFQARSAFTGCGFTTSESEQVVNHPVRRRVVMLLMLLGNAGIVTAMTSLILAFVRAENQSALGLRLGMLCVGVVMLWLAASSRWLARRMERAILWALRRWTTVEVRDYVSLLRLSGDFAVSEVSVSDGDWVVGRTLAELDLHSEGITILGIQKRPGQYEGVPTGSSMISAGDTLLVYGRTQAIQSLDVRRQGVDGDQRHRQAVLDAVERLRQEQSTTEETDAEAGSSPPPQA